MNQELDIDSIFFSFSLQVRGRGEKHFSGSHIYLFFISHVFSSCPNERTPFSMHFLLPDFLS